LLLRLANLPNFALDRLIRYEATLWRESRQILLALDALDRRKPQERTRFCIDAVFIDEFDAADSKHGARPRHLALSSMFLSQQARLERAPLASSVPSMRHIPRCYVTSLNPTTAK
jgi:hypothetical protein